MKRTLVFGLVMLLVASGLGMFMTPASAAEEPLNLMVSNVTETSFTLSWTTENAVTGHVVIGAANFYDVRGSGYAGTTHYVEIGGRSPNTPYTFTVHSDGTAYSATLPFNQVTTLVMSPLPPMSHAVYGKVFEVDGTTPAEDTIVYMESATSEFEPISALTDANGEYFMNLGDIRKDDGSYYFDGTDFSAEITAQGGALGSITATRTLGASSPPEEIGDITLYAIDISIVAGDISIQTTPVYATVANQVTARVRNVGLYLAEDITVSFYEDDVLIGTPQLIASIPHTGTSYADVSVAWTPAAESPGVDIKVVVEPAPGVVDLNMANNEATKTGVVVLPAPAPDMSIVTADISFSPASPGGGDDVDITAIVRNLGNANGTVDVKFWRGSVGGTLIGEVLGVQVNRTAPTFRTVKILDWTIPVGNNIVFVELANVNPADSNPANNVANKSIYANPPEPDLQIWSNGITFTPTSPVVDSAVTITAKVLNNGTTIASCDVNFWEGASGSGTLLHTAHLASVAGMGHANAVYSGWLIPPGTTTITVEVFNSTPAEILLDNNEASKTITSRQPDLSIVAGDITFLPQGTDEDADFEMRAVIRNLGNAPGEGTVTFHTGTSAGPILAGPTPIPSIAAGGSTTITEVGFLPNPGDVKIYVVITDVTPTETSAANNIAFKTQTVYAVGPVVTYQYPLADDTGIEIDVVIEIEFSQSMNVSSVNNAFTLRLGETNIGHTKQWLAGNTLLRVTPAALLSYNSVYTVRIRGDLAKNIDGTFFDGDNNGIPGGDLQFSFSTEPVPDTQGPEAKELVVTPNPTGAATSINLYATIDDTYTGNSVIKTAEYSFGTLSTPGATWILMTANNSLDSPVEGFRALINVASLQEATTYHIWVRGTDQAENVGPGSRISFYKSDLTAPTDENDEEWMGIQALTNTGVGGELQLTFKAAKDANPITYKIYAQAGSAPSTTGTPWATYNEPQTPGDDITVKIDGLTNGNVWFVKVVAEDSEGNRAVPAGSLSRTPTDTTPPWFAGLASITDPLKDGDSLTLSWKLAEDKNTGPATKDLPLTYNIYYGKTSETFSWAAKTTLQIDPNPNATYQHVITGLDAGVEYRFLVSVVDPAGNNDTNMVFRTATPLDETAPTFAGLATATNTGAGGAVRLEWTEAIDQSDVEYMILKSTTQGVFNDPPVIISNTFFNVEGLTNNQQYWFRVWARDIFGNTRYVNNSDKSATPADTQAPWFASTEWSAEDQETGGAVKLTWSQAVDNNTAPGASWAFRVFRKLATSPSYPDTPLATIPYDPLLTEYEYVDTGRTNGVAYHYQVRARDNTGNVYALVQKTVTPTDKEPPVFAGITAAATPAGTEGIVRIEWAAAMDGNTDPNGEIYYKIYRRVSGTTTWGEAIATVLIEQTPYFDNGGSGSSTVGSLTIGETYEYRVLAFDDSNNQNLGPVILPVLVEDKLAPRFNGASVWGEDLGTGKSVRLYWAAATDSSTPVRYNVYFDTLETFVPDPANRIVSKALGTSVIIENLPANDVEYWFIVRPVDAKDNEQAGEDYPIMLKPTDVTPPVWTTTVGIQIAEDLGTYGEVRLSWGEATDNTGPITYLVYYSKLEANVFNTIRATTTQTTLDIAGLDNGVRYYFGIRVRDSAATPNTDTNTIILAATPSDTVKPLFNGLATVTPDAEGGILHLSWTAATDASTAYGKQINYNVYLSTQEQITVSGPADNTYLLASTTLTSYKVEKDLRGDPLVNGRIYYFLVKAIDSSSNMDINTVVLNGTPEDTTAPEFAGASVARDLEYGGAVRIEWSAGKDKYGVTYRIFRSDDPNFNGGVPGDQNNPPIAQNLVGLFYEDTGLLNGQTYYYIVWARDVNGNFNKSQTVPIAITPSDKVAPSFAGLQSVVDRQRGGQLLLSWNDATDTTTAPGVQSDITYRIYRDTTENVRVEPTYLWQTVTTTTFLDTGLTNGQTYWYIVKAVDGAGNVDGARIVRLSGIPTRENTAPSLAPEALGFSPANKIGATQVTFRVLYTDVDGDKPDYVRVVVESSSGVNEWSMEATDAGASPDYVNGVIYQRIQTIEPGDYKYYFKCRDSPGAASFEGPKPYATSPKEDIKIFSRNTAPVLREMAVTPTFGDVKTEFSFTAIYTDADGDVPVNMRVVINNQPYDMVMITGGADYTQPSTWSFSTTLEKGTHTYYFFVSDGQGNSYTSSTRNLEVVDAEVEERGGDFLTNFLNDEYYGLTGFVWLVLLIILIIGIIAVASMAGGKKQSPPKKGAEGEQAPAPGETISCPTCNSKLLVNTTERPVTVECPSCHSQLKVS